MKDEQIKLAFDRAVKYFQDKFKTTFSPALEIGEYDSFFDITMDANKVIVNKSRLVKYVNLLNEHLRKFYNSFNPPEKEITARLVHEITEIFLHTSGGLKHSLKIFPYFHDFADFIEDIYREENDLFPHAHSYKFFGLLEMFKKIKPS